MEPENRREAGSDAVIVRLDRMLTHVLEPAMRRRLVHEALVAGTPDEAFAILRRVMHRRQGEAPPGSGVDLLRDVLHEVLLDLDGEYPLSYEFRRALYEAATGEEDALVARILRSVPPRQELAHPDAQLPKDLADVPLGRRRSLARGDDPRLLEKLALDPDPIVIRHLLANPRTRESDVVRIAALRPVAASTLFEVFRHPHWAARTRIRVALARNPYCPVHVALKVMGGIPLADLREMRDDRHLHPETRRHAEAELDRRHVR